MPPVSDHSDVGVTSQPGLFSSPGSTEERKTAPANNHTGVEAAFQALGIPCEANIKIELKKHLSLLEENGENENATVEVLNAPLFTQSVREHTLGLSKPEPEPTTYSQYGLLAGDINGPSSQNRDPRIFYNIAAPSSVFICGSQGSGKSHSLSCLLENALIPSDANVLPKPLTGIAFHYDTFISDTGGSPCEVAFLSSHKGVKVRVLCAPTNIAQIRRIYKDLPNVAIEELRINETDLNSQRMLDLMAVSSTEGVMPLYLHTVTRILRELRLEQQSIGGLFEYGKFKRLLDKSPLTEGQLAPLQQRLDTLESFMNQSQAKSYQMGKTRRHASRNTGMYGAKGGNDWAPNPGQLTIVDLSCPCITAEMACSLFGICLSLFLEQRADIGRIVALDEAHKYMGDSAESEALTKSLLSTIRVQRHVGARVIISTQEPTISPKLLDLCSVTIVHRFTSPDWMATLKQHLAGASKRTGDSGRDKSDEEDCEEESGVVPLRLDPSTLVEDLFSEIVSLRPGQALIFSPSAVVGLKDSEPAEQHAIENTSFGVFTNGNSEDGSSRNASSTNGERGSQAKIVRLGNGVLKVRVRKRITQDGGRSIMAS